MQMKTIAKKCGIIYAGRGRPTYSDTDIQVTQIGPLTTLFAWM